MGVLTAEAVPGNQILYYIKAMVKLFTAYGNYENRAKARTRYMQEVLGGEYAEAYRKKLAEAMQEENLDIQAAQVEVTKKPDCMRWNTIRSEAVRLLQS